MAAHLLPLHSLSNSFELAWDYGDAVSKETYKLVFGAVRKHLKHFLLSFPQCFQTVLSSPLHRLDSGGGAYLKKTSVKILRIYRSFRFCFMSAILARNYKKNMSLIITGDYVLLFLTINCPVFNDMLQKRGLLNHRAIKAEIYQMLEYLCSPKYI